jgi:hypothetical protein
LITDLNSDISEVEISIIKCDIQSVFDIYNLIRGVTKIFVSGSNALYKDSKNFLFLKVKKDQEKY